MSEGAQLDTQVRRAPLTPLPHLPLGSLAALSCPAAPHLGSPTRSLVYLFDSSEVAHAALVLPHEEAMEEVVAQVTACLLAMSSVAEGRCSLETTAPMVSNLCAQVAQLVLAVEMGAARQSADEEDVVVGLAALGVLQTTCTAVQLIQAAVVGLFGSAADRERAAAEGLQLGLESAMEAQLLVHLGRGSAVVAEGLERRSASDA